MAPRLFTFGCSFTQYDWPTWADIIGRQFDFYQNWGRCGAGNQFIFNSLIECHIKNQLSENDLVCIMFTNFCREDRYVENTWVTGGNVFTSMQWDEKFVRKWADIRGYYIRDLATIYAIDKLLTQIGCKKFYFSMVDIHNPHQYEQSDFSDELSDLLEIYRPTIDKIRPSVHKTVFDYDWYSKPNYNFLHIAYGIQHYSEIKDPSWPGCRSKDDFLNLPEHIQKECRERFNIDETTFVPPLHISKLRDPHPVTLEHLEYLEKVCPEIVITEDTKDWVHEIHRLGSTQQDYGNLLDYNILSSKPHRW